jgi:ribosomal RNA-processing protein 12
MVSTLDLFLTSKNREIVRSVLGFVKVSIISLPKDVLLPRLKTLVPNLMVWSHEHKAHFKAKVKHIIERMIRRFGYDAVERHVPEEDKKLVINIRKTKERKKRNKETTADGEGEKVVKVSLYPPKNTISKLPTNSTTIEKAIPLCLRI